MSAANIPGKMIFFGGFSVLESGNASLSFAVYDNEGKGVVAKAKKADKDLLVSMQFGIRSGTERWKENVAMTAFFVARQYLLSLGRKQRYEVELTNSPMFGQEDGKSGLGSSSAATVAVVKALFKAEGLDAQGEAAHRLCQYAYALYAGKAGSGYDIACAWLGKSAYYERFDPSCIILPDGNGEAQVRHSLLASLQGEWRGMKVLRAKIHPKYSLRFFNLEGGSTDTINSVKAVLDWSGKNARQYAQMVASQDRHERAAIAALEKGDDGGIRESVHNAREVHRQLQEKVASSYGKFDPIEPEELGELIRFGESLKGVVAGRCPGAGGYDGVAFIVEERRLEKGFEKKLEEKAAELSLKAKSVSLKLA